MHFKIPTIVIGLFLLVPTFTFAQTSSTISSPVQALTTATTSALSTSSSTAIAQDILLYPNSAAVKARVTSYFADIPVMIAVASCESGFTQYNSNGQTLGEEAGSMIGIYQINKSTHASLAASLGFNIDTVDGNIGFARYLYSKSGTDPWISSFPCWSKSTTNPENATTTAIVNTSPAGTAPVVSTSASTATPVLTANLSFGMSNPQVVTLQQILNALGYVVAASGPGSKGNETSMFGNFTRVSIKQFQCAKGIVCSGDEASTGYGYVGSRTRAALLSAFASSGVAISSSPAIPSAQSASSSSTVTATNNAAAITALQAQISSYQQLISGLNATIAALQAGQ